MTQATRRRKRLTASNKAEKRSALFIGISVGITTVIFAAFVGVVALASTWLQDLPTVDNLDEYTTNSITTIYASDGETKLAEIYTTDRIPVELDEISEYVILGTIATEDQRFYEHNGYDLIGIARAAISNLTGGSEGASTITQQLVRNTVLLDEMNDITFERKVREIYLAVQAEEQYSKDEILNLYLNVINYGNNCYGIEAAAQNYFGVSASELTLSQAALLVGIPNSPSYYEPRDHYENAIARRNVVLVRMLSCGYITQEEYEEAIADEPEILEENTLHDDVSDIAPYFVDYVESLLETEDYISETAYQLGGLSIYTTLDPDCQVAAVDAIESVLADYDLDAALVSIDPDNGFIVAMVGGRDYSENTFNLATQMSRQAGSSFKPFALAAALEMGISASTLFDATSPAQITDEWTVNNSEGDGTGYVTLEYATIQSLNTVYARLTHDVIGADAIVDMAYRCGIQSTLNAVDSICLGTQGVNPLEMASAYATFANGGIYYEPVAILSVVSASGETIYEYEEQEGERVISEALAEAVTEILKKVVTSGTATRAQQSNGQVVAGKTGTSSEARDLWFVGYSPQYATAVWSGYRDDSATSYYGSRISVPIWDAYMETVLDGVELEDFPTTDEKLIYTSTTSDDDADDAREALIEEMKEQLREELSEELTAIMEAAEETAGSNSASSSDSSDSSTSTSSNSDNSSTSDSSGDG